MTFRQRGRERRRIFVNMHVEWGRRRAARWDEIDRGRGGRQRERDEAITTGDKLKVSIERRTFKINCREKMQTKCFCCDEREAELGLIVPIQPDLEFG